jgi:hypothetical protein
LNCKIGSSWFLDTNSFRKAVLKSNNCGQELTTRLSGLDAQQIKKLISEKSNCQKMSVQFYLLSFTGRIDTGLILAYSVKQSSLDFSNIFLLSGSSPG